MMRTFGYSFAPVLLIAPATGLAFECLTVDGACSCQWINGDSQNYHILTNDFSGAEITDIVGGAGAWDAGAGEINRGADWHFERASDVSNWGQLNFRWDVAAEDSEWFEEEGIPEFSAVTLTRRWACARIETDIIFNSDENWCTTIPSKCTSGVSVPQVAAHEFGHAFGFDHDEGHIALMNSGYPCGGDVGGTPTGLYRINEDEYAGLVSVKADASTGNNVALSKFRLNGVADEVWDTTFGTGDDGVRDWSACPNTCITTNAPNAILAITMGTSTLNSVDTRWTLSSDTTCMDGDDVTIDTDSRTLSVGTPASISPDWCVPSGTAPGNYYVCAKIDYTNEITEASENDNVLISERLFEVESGCP